MLAIAAGLTVFVPALSYVAAADGSLVARWSPYQTARVAGGYLTTDMQCAKNRSAESLDQRFSDRFGPVLGLDNAHVIDLGSRRYLWLFNDTFVDYTSQAERLVDGTMLNNAAVLEDDRCFTLVVRGEPRNPRSFEHGPRADTAEHYFWPLGGEAHGGRIHIFWAEMLSTRDAPHVPSDGLNRHPLRTWLGTYDARSLARLSFRAAPNDGVFPQYGFAVASDGQYTYLFGKSNMLDLSREGGFYVGPHSATEMYLARVPRGQLGDRPEYRTAVGWSNDEDDAVPISSRFWTENGMQPRYLNGHWVAVTKADGFWGTKTVVETAKRPWGPWKLVSRREIKPFRGFEEMTNYQPIILPDRDPSGDLIIVMSQNARRWPQAVNDPSMYRLDIYSEPWPFAE